MLVWVPLRPVCCMDGTEGSQIIHLKVSQIKAERLKSQSFKVKQCRRCSIVVDHQSRHSIFGKRKVTSQGYLINIYCYESS